MKTDITTEIEKKLIKLFLSSSTRFALEVPIKDGENHYGLVDFVTADFTEIYHLPKITCYEIKVSYGDYKSENGHNMYGDENYYVMPIELYEEIIKKQQDRLLHGHPFGRNGVYILTKRGALRKTLGSSPHKTIDLEKKMYILNQMLMRWESGTMFRELKKHNIEMRNFS